MKILVLGSNGMAGHMISRYLSKNNCLVTGFARRGENHSNFIKGDIKDIDSLASVIRDNKYDAVVNCIGILNKKAETFKSEAVFINSFLPHFLANLTKNTNTKIVHLSTDCVFSGKVGNYTEECFPDGISYYDRSKSLGELNDDKNITFRNSLIGPDVNKEGIGLLNWFLMQRNTVHGYAKVIWSGVTTLHLAQAILIGIKNDNTGLHHLVNNFGISKYDLLNLFNKYFRRNKLEIIKDNNVTINKSLLRKKYDLNYEVPDYEKMVYDLAIYIKENSKLYPHYSISF